MTPVYKISASSVTGRTTYGSMLAGNPAFNPSSFESIATITLSSSGGAYFTNIPQTYTHLQLRGIVRNNVSLSTDWVYTRLNSDNGNNYATHRLLGDGASASVAAATSVSYSYDFMNISSSGTANIYGAFVLDILDYANTNKFKTIRTLGGYDSNGSGVITLSSAVWQSTAAVSTVGVDGASLGLVVGSTVALYGIKGAA